MSYTGRITLISISIVFSFISIFIFKDSLLEQIPTSLIALILSWVFGKQYDNLKFLSEKDFLTKVFNRRYVYKVFPTLMKKNKYISLLVIDVNHFKQINDRFGHENGDRALIKLSNLLVANTRKTDIVARWGGDEFLVICPSIKAEETEKLIDKIYQEVEKKVNQYNLDVKISFSVGKAIYPLEGRSLDELIRIADRRMYLTKKRKRLI